MAYAGQILDNPVSGERIIFRETAADTNGERLSIDLVLAPDGHVPGKHVHPEQIERFEVTGGTMKFTMGRKKIVAQAGDIVVVPAGTAHKFSNAGDGPATARVEVTPALRMEDLFETAVALAEAGRTNKKGLPEAARPRTLRQGVRARGRGRVPAGVGAEGVAGSAALDRGQARAARCRCRTSPGLVGDASRSGVLR